MFRSFLLLSLSMSSDVANSHSHREIDGERGGESDKDVDEVDAFATNKSSKLHAFWTKYTRSFSYQSSYFHSSDRENTMQKVLNMCVCLCVFYFLVEFYSYVQTRSKRVFTKVGDLMALAISINSTFTSNIRNQFIHSIEHFVTYCHNHFVHVVPVRICGYWIWKSISHG